MTWTHNTGQGGTSPFGLGAPAPILADGSHHQMALLEVNNTSTEIFDAPQYLAQLIDFYTKYPTQTATNLASGWVPPDIELGPVWDGWIHLTKTRRDGRLEVPTGLLDLCVWICERFGFRYQVVDKRIRPEDNFAECYEPIVDRPYQLAAVEAAMRHERGVIVMPPRGGKTRTFKEIHRRRGLRCVWIAPSKNICAQTLAGFDQWFGKHYAAHVTGSQWRDHLNTRVVICTDKSASSFPEEFYATREELVIDEFHHAAARTYHDIVAKCSNIFYRYGLTGTFFRSGSDALAMHAILSRAIFTVTTTELRDANFIVPGKVVVLPVVGPTVKGGSNFQKGAGGRGLYAHNYRNDLVVWAARLLAHYKRTVLILVGTKAQGVHLRTKLQEVLTPSQVANVSGDEHDEKNQRLIRSFASGESDLRVLIGTSMVGEGTDLPAADALILARGGKAEVQLVQGVFRVVTKRAGKVDAIIVDFADRHNDTLLEHSLARIRTYFDEPLFDVDVLADPSEFADWLAKKAGRAL